MSTKSSLPYGYSIHYVDTGERGYLCGPEGKTPSVWVTLYPGKEGGTPIWLIADQSDRRIPLAVRQVGYPTPELAAAVGMAVCRAHDKVMEQYSVPKELLDAIERAERTVDELACRAQDMARQVHFAQNSVNGLRQAAGLPELEWGTDDLVTRLNTFTLCAGKAKYMKHPFFTEATLYPLLGKEDARSVLALIAQAKRRVDPVGGAI